MGDPRIPKSAAAEMEGAIEGSQVAMCIGEYGYHRYIRVDSEAYSGRSNLGVSTGEADLVEIVG